MSRRSEASAPITGMGVTQLAWLCAPRKGACATAAYEQHEEGRALAAPALLLALIHRSSWNMDSRRTSPLRSSKKFEPRLSP